MRSWVNKFESWDDFIIEIDSLLDKRWDLNVLVKASKPDNNGGKYTALTFVAPRKQTFCTCEIAMTPEEYEETVKPWVQNVVDRWYSRFTDSL